VLGTRVGFADRPHAKAALVAVDLGKLIALSDEIRFDTAAVPFCKV
jgi:NADPH2:quinone reductase